MDSKKLKDILNQHKMWLTGEEGGKCANLCDANLCDAGLRNTDLRNVDLRNADLRGADLRNVDLRNADLRGADLYGAALCGAALCGANLRRADLCGADLRYTDLRDAVLRNADLRNAVLCGADLFDADLRNADLYGADLCNAVLCGANLRGVNLRSVNLRSVNLLGAQNIELAENLFYPICCPEKGAYIGWKKAGEMIVELEITDDALRSSATGRKCRANKARVLSITSLDGTKSAESICSDYNKEFIYRVGETVEVDNFEMNRWNECAPGIHHYITREEAVRHI